MWPCTPWPGWAVVFVGITIPGGSSWNSEYGTHRLMMVDEYIYIYIYICEYESAKSIANRC